MKVDKIEKEYRNFIEQMFNKYSPILFMQKYDLGVIKDDKNYLASKFNYPYLDVTIEYSDDAIDQYKRDKGIAERELLHEFCHVITDQFYVTCIGYHSKEQMEQARERMVDHIAQIINKNIIKKCY